MISDRRITFAKSSERDLCPVFLHDLDAPDELFRPWYENSTMPYDNQYKCNFLFGFRGGLSVRAIQDNHISLNYGRLNFRIHPFQVSSVNNRRQIYLLCKAMMCSLYLQVDWAPVSTMSLVKLTALVISPLPRAFYTCFPAEMLLREMPARVISLTS